ncbi:hypothetical protein ACKVEX_09905 [Rhodocyclaceae bacterium SMB388]
MPVRASSRSEGANSTRVANDVVARLKATNPHAKLELCNLARDPALLIDETVLGFPGMTDIRFVYAEGLNMGDDAMKQGFAEAEADIAAALA